MLSESDGNHILFGTAGLRCKFTVYSSKPTNRLDVWLSEMPYYYYYCFTHERFEKPLVLKFHFSTKIISYNLFCVVKSCDMQTSIKKSQLNFSLFRICLWKKNCFIESEKKTSLSQLHYGLWRFTDETNSSKCVRIADPHINKRGLLSTFYRKFFFSVWNWKKLSLDRFMYWWTISRTKFSLYK